MQTTLLSQICVKFCSSTLSSLPWHLPENIAYSTLSVLFNKRTSKWIHTLTNSLNLDAIKTKISFVASSVLLTSVFCSKALYLLGMNISIFQAAQIEIHSLMYGFIISKILQAVSFALNTQHFSQSLNN